MFFKDERTNTIILSIIWGLGLAALFICDGNSCIVIKALRDMDSYRQEKKNNCYIFERNNTNALKIIKFINVIIIHNFI